MHYLDNASTTKPCFEAVEAAVRAMSDDFGNPSSLHRLGSNAQRLVEGAREEISSAIGSKPGEIYFTSGGTEADNWAILSAASLLKHRGAHIITTAVEHEAVLNTCRRLETQGFTVTYLEPDSSGAVSVQSVEQALRADTILVSAMLVNNETGAVSPIAEIAQALKAARSRAILHTDAVQALLKIPVDVRSLGVDLLSLSAHKIHGIKGCGALYINSALRFAPLLYGGGQEGNLRSGTHGVPQIAAFGAACRAGRAELAASGQRILQLRDNIISRLGQDIPECICIYGSAPHILTLSIPGCPSQPVLNLLAAKEIFVSAGSACSRGKRSHVLRAIGLQADVTDCAIRVSLSRFSTQEDVDALCNGLLEAKAKFAGRSNRR